MLEDVSNSVPTSLALRQHDKLTPPLPHHRGPAGTVSLQHPFPDLSLFTRKSEVTKLFTEEDPAGLDTYEWKFEYGDAKDCNGGLCKYTPPNSEGYVGTYSFYVDARNGGCWGWEGLAGEWRAEETSHRRAEQTKGRKHLQHQASYLVLPCTSQSREIEVPSPPTRPVRSNPCRAAHRITRYVLFVCACRYAPVVGTTNALPLQEPPSAST